MDLEVKPPFAPMEAELVSRIPEGGQWVYEPKWDGFRCVVFRDGGEVELQSKAGQSLTRYFPEVAENMRRLPAARFVLDCEVVVPVDGVFSFEELLMRIHPAESRVRKLAREHPALLIAFDLLADDQGNSLLNLPLSVRRDKLEKFLLKVSTSKDSVQLSPFTNDISVARGWLDAAGGSVDGIIAKRADLDYRSGERTGMLKVKLIRTVDCVVGGFRYASSGPLVGSLLLGLYDEKGLLHHVGFTSGIKKQSKPELTARLESLVEPPGFTGRTPGGPSRWSTERSGEWKPVRPELVAEVTFSHFSGGRFRHGTKFLRWRPDKTPRQCTMDQVRTTGLSPLDLLAGRASR